MSSETGSFRADDERTVALYTDSVAEHGSSYRATCWGSAQGQSNRFGILADIGLRSGTSILDVGCGLGDFLGWIHKAGIDADYTGLDITPAMIETARAAYSSGKFHLVGSGTGPGQFGIRAFDYVIASGIFTFRRHEPFAFLCAMADAMYEACRIGVAFNCLSDWYNGTDDEYREDPLRVLAHCRTRTPRVALRHDYHPGDFTIYMKRTDPEPQ